MRDGTYMKPSDKTRKPPEGGLSLERTFVGMGKVGMVVVLANSNTERSDMAEK